MFLSEHDLNDGLYWLIERDSASKYLPSWLMLHLIASHHRGQGRRKDLLHALKQLAQTSGDAGVQFVLLKGFDYSQRFYGDIQARQVRDIDVLTKPEQQQTMAQVLTELGYTRQDTSLLPRLLPADVRRKLEHAQTWQKEYISIDLHHGLRSRPGFRLPVQALIERTETLPLEGHYYQVPADYDALCLVLITLATDIEQGKLKARDLLDAEVLITAAGPDFDWSGWLQQLKQARILPIIQAVLSILRGALPGPRPWPEWLRRAGCSVQAAPVQQCLERCCARPYGLDSRRWFMQHYQGSRGLYLCWWLIGGFFREGSVGRVRDQLRSKPRPLA